MNNKGSLESNNAKIQTKKVYSKNQNTTNWNNYKYQQNFCTNLLRKRKFDYFYNLKVKDLNVNKKFWKKDKPLFSDKGLASSNMF